MITTFEQVLCKGWIQDLRKLANGIKSEYSYDAEKDQFEVIDFINGGSLEEYLTLEELLQRELQPLIERFKNDYSSRLKECYEASAQQTLAMLHCDKIKDYVNMFYKLDGKDANEYILQCLIEMSKHISSVTDQFRCQITQSPKGGRGAPSKVNPEELVRRANELLKSNPEGLGVQKLKSKSKIFLPKRLKEALAAEFGVHGDTIHNILKKNADNVEGKYVLKPESKLKK